MEEKIDILLATYNGEKYLKEQLDSILNQTYKNIRIIISDDCSKDTTPEILKEYQKKDDRIELHIQKNNLGVVKNIEFLLREVKSPYYMLADQDDYWLPEKAEKSLEKLKEELAQANATEDKILKDYKAYANGKLLTGTMANREATTDAVSVAASGDYAYIRIPQGGYLTNASSGYPEIKASIADINNATGYKYTQSQYDESYNNGYNAGTSAGKTTVSGSFSFHGDYQHATSWQIKTGDVEYSKAEITARNCGWHTLTFLFSGNKATLSGNTTLTYTSSKFNTITLTGITYPAGYAECNFTINYTLYP